MIFPFFKNTNFLQVIRIIIILKFGVFSSVDEYAFISLWTFRTLRRSHPLFTSVMIITAAAAAATPAASAAAATSTMASAVFPAVSVVPAVAAFLRGRELTGQPQGWRHRLGCDWRRLGRRLHGRWCGGWDHTLQPLPFVRRLARFAHRWPLQLGGYQPCSHSVGWRR